MRETKHWSPTNAQWPWFAVMMILIVVSGAVAHYMLSANAALAEEIGSTQDNSKFVSQFVQKHVKPKRR